MRLCKLAFRAAVLAAAALSAAQAQAQLVASSFGIVAQPVDGEAVQVAPRNHALLKLEVRPLAAVTLAEAIPADLAAQFGAKSDIPFETSLQLNGWPERPGLYCDLLRPRGLGISAACLRDTDLDGRFDEGVRLDFNSGRGEILMINHKGKIIGVRNKGKPVRLPHPIAYAPVAPASIGKLELRWSGRKVSGVLSVEMGISTPDNYTGTEGLAESYLLFPRDRIPLDVELYGIRLRILGFDETGAMRYQLLGMTDGAVVPLLFRGYTFRIISY